MSESAIDQFNRLIGNRTGRPQAKGVKRAPVGYNIPAQVRRISQGRPSINTATTRAYNKRTSPVGGSSAYSPSKIEETWDRVFNDLSREYEQTAAEQVAINKANQENEDRPWYGDVWNALGGNNLTDAGIWDSADGGFSDSLIGRGLDLISRPAYGVFEAMQSIAEKEEEDYAGGESMGLGAFWDDLKDIGSGFARGFSGEDKTGFGQVYESLKENEDEAFGNTLRSFEQAHPALEQRVAQATGLAGEIFLDPLNVLIPSAPRVLRETGETLTEQTLRNLNLNAARQATDEFMSNSGLATNNRIFQENPSLLTERIVNSVDDLITRSAVNPQRGGNTGVRLMNDASWPHTVSNNVVTQVQQAFTEFFTDRVDDLWTRGKKGQITPETVEAFRAHSNDYDEFWRKLEDRVFPNTDSTVEDLLAKLPTVSRTTFDEVLTDVISKYSSELERTRTSVFARTQNPSYRTVGLRVGRNKDIPFKTVGRAYDWGASKALNKVFPNRQNDYQRVFFESQFPGVFGMKTGRARALGFNTMDKFRSELQQIARKFPKDETVELHYALEKGINLADPRKQEALDWLRRKYDEIFAEEQAAGARPTMEQGRRPVGSVHGENYMPIYNRGGDTAARTEFKNGRKAAWNDDNVIGAGPWNTAKAKEMGLKPSENAFENLFMRYTKSRRDMTRSIFLEDLVENYSIYNGRPIHKLTDKAIREQGLVKVPYDRLPVHYREMVKPGQEFYLPKPIYDMYERFNELTSWTSQEMGKLGRNFARVIGIIKKGLTVPYLGFHTKNLIGDVAMGLLDDIPFKAYEEVIRKWTLNKAGKRSVFKMIPGEIEHSFDEMLQKYMDNADAGFFNIEFGTYESLTAGAIPRRLGRKVGNKVTDIADTRELIPRFVHFTEAYRQEAQSLWKQGKRNLQEVDKLATEAGLWRVNQYKFDYSALLPWEKKLKTLAFPFYTYLRKALPVLMQQMFMNPRWFSRLNRFMEYNDGSGADVFNELNTPQWIKDIGFATLTDEEEPWAITTDLLPLGALDILGSGDVGELSTSLLSNLNPLAQAPIELATGRQLFNDRPIDGSGWEYLMENIPLLSDVREELGIPIPGTGPVGENIFQQLSDPGKFFTDPARISERMTGFGIPLRQITSGQQEYQHNANFDSAIEQPIQDFNYSQDRYRISWSETAPITFRVKDAISEELLGEFQTPQEAIQFAQKLPEANYQEPSISPLRPPTLADVQAMMQGR